MRRYNSDVVFSQSIKQHVAKMLSAKTQRQTDTKFLGMLLLMLSVGFVACASPTSGTPAEPPSTVALAFAPPAGFTRVDGGQFGVWLQSLKLRDPSIRVRTFAGAEVDHPARVVDMPLAPGDLQQCADSLIRLRADWLKSVGRPITFHATSGDPIPYAKWASGQRPFESGGRLRWKRVAVGTWDEYLAAVFTWAGTRSLLLDTVPADKPQPGDMLLVPGSPGHVVVFLDVATRGDETLVLIGEGYMPAQDFHVELGPNDGWWRLTETIDLGHVAMPAGGLRRWK